MPDVREEFEAWWSSPAQWELRKSCARGWAEIIWQASRAALKVELPKKLIGALGIDGHQHYAEGWNDSRDRVTEVLKQAGIELTSSPP